MANLLNLPVSKLAKRARVLEAGSSLGTAAKAFRTFQCSYFAVSKEGQFTGLVSEVGLKQALEAGADPDGAIEPWLESEPLVLPPYATGAEALRLMSQRNVVDAAVVDESGRIWGLLTPSDLLQPEGSRPYMPTVGGLATPFGVYLTTGSLWAGPRPWGLFATGATMSLMLICAKILSVGVGSLAHLVHFSISATNLDLLTLPFFGLLMRFSPLAGIHAAEHMAVHAIERDEPLTPEVVGRMPRVHPRCGTNLATAVLIISVFGLTDFGLSDWIASFQFIIAFFVAWLGYRKIGGLVQYWVTTKPPSRKQIQMGCKSAEELIEKVSGSSEVRGPIWKTIYNTGLLHVLTGGWATGAIVYFLLHLGHRGSLLTF